MTQTDKKAQPTPGPWTLKTPTGATGDDARDMAIIAGGQIIAEVFYRSDYTITHPVEANARLIAAAPRLKDELRALLEWVERETDGRDWPHERLEAARALLRDVTEG